MSLRSLRSGPAIEPWGICVSLSTFCIVIAVKFWGGVFGAISLLFGFAFLLGIPLWYIIQKYKE